MFGLNRFSVRGEPQKYFAPSFHQITTSPKVGSIISQRKMNLKACIYMQIWAAQESSQIPGCPFDRSLE
jgi:hypothetical protein